MITTPISTFKSIRFLSLLTALLLAGLVAPALAVNYALDCDGSGDYVDTAKTATDLGINGAAPRTVTAWLYTRSFGGGGPWDVGTHTNAQDFSIRTIGENRWRVEYYAYYHDITVDCKNKWVHFAQTYDGTTAVVYANGTPVDTWTLGLNTTDTITFRLGAWGTTSFDGVLDDVRLYSTALTQEQIQSVMIQGIPTTDLIAHWKLDEQTGTVATDELAAHDGTLVGDPQWVESSLFSTTRPDLLIRTDSEIAYTGGDIYNDLPTQTKSQTAGPATTIIYDVQLENEGTEAHQYVVTAPAGNAQWIVRYVDLTNDVDITTDTTAAGWNSPILNPGASLELQMQITPDPCAFGTPTPIELTMRAAAISDPAGKFDEVKAITSYSETFTVGAKTYTLNADFDLGTLVGVEHDTVANQLQLSTTSTALPFIWVPNDNESTVSKIDTQTGRELGRYHTGPFTNGRPSRTTVDLYGNCWVGNRQTGSVVKIGLLENGQYMDRNYNGIIETSRDLNGDGDITGAEMLPWGHDECVLYEVIVIKGQETSNVPGLYTGSYANNYDDPGPRGIAIDSYNNVWIGAHNSHMYYYVDGSTGQILKSIDVTIAGTSRHTAYGAVVDKNGILWSSGQEHKDLLRIDPATDTFTVIEIPHYCYGLGVDRFDHLFVTGWQDTKLTRVDINTAAIDWTKTGKYQSRGVVCTDDGDVWIANTGLNNVSRFTNDGDFIVDIPVGSQPTGVSVDDDGKVWVVNYGDGYIHRIDPDANDIDLSKYVTGTIHYGYSDMTGAVSRSSTTRVGVWTVVHNTYTADSQWGLLSWTTSEPKGTLTNVRVRSSQDRRSWSLWEQAANFAPLRLTPDGRYLEIQVNLQSFTEGVTPILYDLTVRPLPCCGDFDHPFPLGDLNHDCAVDLLDLDIVGNNWLTKTAQDLD